MSDNSMPRGDLTVRSIAMPADTNANGDIFGGWVMAHIDRAGGIASNARGRVVTIAVEAMSFIRPMRVGDVLEGYTEIESVGRTSMKIHIEAPCAALPDPPPRQGHRREFHLRAYRRRRPPEGDSASLTKSVAVLFSLRYTLMSCAVGVSCRLPCWPG